MEEWYKGQCAMWLKGVESIEFVIDSVVTVKCRYHSPGVRVRLLELPYNGRQGSGCLTEAIRQ